MTLGYSMGDVILEAEKTHYIYQTNKIEKSSDQIDNYMQQLEQIKNLLATIRDEAKEGKKQIDFSKDQQKRDLVDTVHAFLPNALGNGYMWKGKEIENLIDNLNQESKMSNEKISLIMVEMNQSLEERNRVTEIVSQILKEIKELSQAILSNIRR